MLQINPTLSFKTAQGSEYFVQGCVTQRNKYQHLLHDVDDKGWKQPSQFTVYIDSSSSFLPFLITKYMLTREVKRMMGIKEINRINCRSITEFPTFPPFFSI